MRKTKFRISKRFVSHYISFYLCVYVSQSIAVYMRLFSECAQQRPGEAAQDDAVAKRLWYVSVQLVHLKDSEIHATLRQSA